MIKSLFLDTINKLFIYTQTKSEKFVNKSCLLSNIDNIVLFMIGLTLFASTFMQSENIGLIALCVVATVFLRLCIRKDTQIAFTRFDCALIIYFIICFISTINSTLLAQSIHGFLKTVIYIFYYFCVANYFQTNQNKIKWILVLVACLCTIESIIALVQNIGGVEQIATWQDSNYINPEDAIARAYGTLKPYNPNLLGGYLVAGLPYVIGTTVLFLYKRHKQFSITTIFAFLLCTLAILATGSRGAYLGLGATIFGFIILVTIIINTDFKTHARLKAIWHRIILALISSFTLVLIAIPKITKRLLSIFMLRGDSSTSFRMNVYNSSWQMFCDNWFLGIGAGNQTFREIYGLYMLTGFDALSTYSVPLEIAVESGIFGLISFLTFIVLFLLDCFNFIKSKLDTIELTDKIIICSSILLLIGVMTHGLFDTIFYRPQVQFLFWTMIAIASSTINKKQKSEA